MGGSVMGFYLGPFYHGFMWVDIGHGIANIILRIIQLLIPK